MLKIKHLNLHFLNQCKYYDNNKKVFCTYDNYWNNWTIRGLKVRTKPYFIGFTTKYVEPCFHIPVIVQHSYLYNLISKQSNSKYSKSNNS